MKHLSIAAAAVGILVLHSLALCASSEYVRSPRVDPCIAAVTPFGVLSAGALTSACQKCTYARGFDDSCGECSEHALELSTLGITVADRASVAAQCLSYVGAFPAISTNRALQCMRAASQLPTRLFDTYAYCMSCAYSWYNSGNNDPYWCYRIIQQAPSFDAAAQMLALDTGVTLGNGLQCNSAVDCRSEEDITGTDLIKITWQTEESCAKLCCERPDCEFWVLDKGRGCYLKKNAVREANTGRFGHWAYNVQTSCFKGPAIANVTYSLPPLAYAFEALEPFFDNRTMFLHHDLHHGAAVKALNTALMAVRTFTFRTQTLATLLAGLSGTTVAPDLVTPIRNNGGSHWNHAFFWTVLAPAGTTTPSDNLLAAITESFGSLAAMQTAFNTAANGRFGSGWAWLVFNPECTTATQPPCKPLIVTSTPNQDNPLMKGLVEVPGIPILGLDMWEHSYYLRNQNRRADYLTAFWNIINWANVESYLWGAMKGRPFDLVPAITTVSASM